MRVLAFADVHGSYEKVYGILSRESIFDVVIIGGDLTTRGSSREAEDVIGKLKSYGKPVLVVAGNMDPPELEESFERLGVSINANGVVVGEVGFFGVSASPETPFHTPYEIPEEEIQRRAEQGWRKVRSASQTVFVPHAPPKNTSLDKVFPGTHVGSLAVRAFIEQHRPDAVICGHIHEARGKDMIGRSVMVNCGPAGKGYYAVLEMGESISVELKG